MSKQIAKDLLSIRAVFLRPDDPFTWASGIKSPIYCDNRLVLSDHKVRTDVETGLMEVIKENYPADRTASKANWRPARRSSSSKTSSPPAAASSMSSTP